MGGFVAPVVATVPDCMPAVLPLLCVDLPYHIIGKLHYVAYVAD